MAVATPSSLSSPKFGVAMTDMEGRGGAQALALAALLRLLT